METSSFYSNSTILPFKKTYSSLNIILFFFIFVVVVVTSKQLQLSIYFIHSFSSPKCVFFFFGEQKSKQENILRNAGFLPI